LSNIFEIEWWNSEPEIKTWLINGKYRLEVRANEFEYHPPHFHVSYNDYSAVFRLDDGRLYKNGKKEFSLEVKKEITEWYSINRLELNNAWNNLHKTMRWS
jgi:hypothetical protein